MNFIKSAEQIKSLRPSQLSSAHKELEYSLKETIGAIEKNNRLQKEEIGIVIRANYLNHVHLPSDEDFLQLRIFDKNFDEFWRSPPVQYIPGRKISFKDAPSTIQYSRHQGFLEEVNELSILSESKNKENLIIFFNAESDDIYDKFYLIELWHLSRLHPPVKIAFNSNCVKLNNCWLTVEGKRTDHDKWLEFSINLDPIYTGGKNLEDKRHHEALNFVSNALKYFNNSQPIRSPEFAFDVGIYDRRKLRSLFLKNRASLLSMKLQNVEACLNRPMAQIKEKQLIPEENNDLDPFRRNLLICSDESTQSDIQVNSLMTNNGMEQTSDITEEYGRRKIEKKYHVTESQNTSIMDQNIHKIDQDAHKIDQDVHKMDQNIYQKQDDDFLRTDVEFNTEEIDAEFDEIPDELLMSSTIAEMSKNNKNINDNFFQTREFRDLSILESNEELGKKDLDIRHSSLVGQENAIHPTDDEVTEVSRDGNISTINDGIHTTTNEQNGDVGTTSIKENIDNITNEQNGHVDTTSIKENIHNITNEQNRDDYITSVEEETPLPILNPISNDEVIEDDFGDIGIMTPSKKETSSHSIEVSEDIMMTNFSEDLVSENPTSENWEENFTGELIENIERKKRDKKSKKDKKKKKKDKNLKFQDKDALALFTSINMLNKNTSDSIGQNNEEQNDSSFEENSLENPDSNSLKNPDTKSVEIPNSIEGPVESIGDSNSLEIPNFIDVQVESIGDSNSVEIPNNSIDTTKENQSILPTGHSDLPPSLRQMSNSMDELIHRLNGESTTINSHEFNRIYNEVFDEGESIIDKPRHSFNEYHDISEKQVKNAVAITPPKKEPILSPAPRPTVSRITSKYTTQDGQNGEPSSPEEIARFNANSAWAKLWEETEAKEIEDERLLRHKNRSDMNDLVGRSRAQVETLRSQLNLSPKKDQYSPKLNLIRDKGDPMSPSELYRHYRKSSEEYTTDRLSKTMNFSNRNHSKNTGVNLNQTLNFDRIGDTFHHRAVKSEFHPFRNGGERKREPDWMKLFS